MLQLLWALAALFLIPASQPWNGARQENLDPDPQNLPAPELSPQMQRYRTKEMTFPVDPKGGWPLQQPMAEDLAMLSPMIETVTVVNSSASLRAALARGDPHIQLRAHLNLSGTGGWGATSSLGVIPWAVQSIQGNCSAAPSDAFLGDLHGPRLLQRAPRQCIIVSDSEVMYVRHGNMLLDNMYLRRQSSAWNSPALIQLRDGRWLPWQQPVQLWMSNITMQGGSEDGRRECSTCGIRNYDGKLHAQECMLADFHGGKVVTVGDGDSASSFQRCSFEHNQLAPDTAFDGDHAVINALEWTDPEYTLEDDSQVLVRLEGCEFMSNQAEHVLVASHGDGFTEAAFYSDTRMPVFVADAVGAHTSHTHKLSSAPKKLFLTAADEWISQLRME